MEVFYAAMSIVGQFLEQEDEARRRIILRLMLSRCFEAWAQEADVLPPPLVSSSEEDGPPPLVSSSEEDSEDDDWAVMMIEQEDEDSVSDDDDDRDLGISQQERRTDPMLGGERVTYAEMCNGLRDQQLSQAQLQEHWNNLQKHPGEVPESAPKPEAGA